MSKLPNTPFLLPCPNQPPTPLGGGPPPKTLTRWDTFIGDIASGLPLTTAMEKCYITRADIETMCRLDDGGLQRQRWLDARTAGRKSAWTVFEFEDIFERIASGMKVDDAVMAVKGKTAHETSFYALINSDSDLRAQYRVAKEACSLVIGEELFDYADDKRNDTLAGPKGGEIPNMAAVSRSKLQVETRLRYIGAYNARLFGEKKEAVNVQVNLNYAERLEEARTRATQRETRVTPKQMQQAIDATFSEKTATVDSDTTWMDDKPTDTVWREEK
jgi:hypothetical protein